MMTSASPSSREGLPGAPGPGGNRMSESGYSITDLTLEQALIRIKEIEDENRTHRDNLREHNAVMREQCENLAMWRKREQEKFEQAKALITALTEENRDMQVQIMAWKDKEKELSSQVTSLAEERSHLVRQKAISEQRIFNLIKEAEGQGVKGLTTDAGASGGRTEECAAPETIVFVSTSEKEAEIAKLEAAVATKDETIAELRAAQLKREQEVETLHGTTQQLLKDMQNQQQLKDSVQEENRSLTHKLMQAEMQLHDHLKSQMANTRREMLTPLSSGMGEKPSMSATIPSAGSTGVQVSYRDNPEMIAGALQSLDAEKRREQVRQELERKVAEGQSAREELQAEVDNLASQVKKLHVDLDREKLEASEIQQRAEREMATLTERYEDKLKELAQQGSQRTNQPIQASNTEDVSILRSQVLTLINEVDEAHSKYSALSDMCHLKDNKIRELEEGRKSVQSELGALWQEKTRLIQNLQAQHGQLERAQQENVKIKQQYQQLRDSFNQLVTDYKDLEEMFETHRNDHRQLQTNFESYKQQMEEKMTSRNTSRQTMEEINRLTAQVIAAEEAMARKDEKLAEVKTLEEQVQLWKCQAEFNQSDFNAERESRAKLAEERDSLIREVNGLREQNRELREERDAYNTQQMHNMQARHTGVQNPPLRNWTYAPTGSPHMLVSASPSGGNLMPGQGQAMNPPLPAQPNGAAYLPTSQQQQQHQYGGLGVAAAIPGGAGDEDDLRSFQPYECPSCRAQFPDADTVQLHVTECLEKD